MRYEPKFTPGPWLYQQHLLWHGTGKLMPEELIKLPDIIGWVYGAFNEDPEALANARLIAAAPSLYEACSEILSGLEQITPMGEWRLIDEWKAKAHAALARATGEMP